MHYRKPDPVVHPYPHHRDQPHHCTAQEKVEVGDISSDSNRHAYDPDDDYEVEMGLVGALR